MIPIYNFPHKIKIDGNGYLLDGTLFLGAYSYVQSRIIDISQTEWWNVHLNIPFNFSDWRVVVSVSMDAAVWVAMFDSASTGALNTYVQNYYPNTWNYLTVETYALTGGIVPNFNMVMRQKGSLHVEA
jgi:hypothetical protein